MPVGQPLGMEITGSSVKLRANFPAGQKQFPARKRILALVIGLLGAFVEPTLAKVDFSGLEGTFRGDYKLEVGSPDLAGRLTARLRVNDGGKRLVIVLYGSLSPSQRNPVPLASYTRLVLTTKRGVTSNSVYIGANRLRAAGKTTFTSRNNTLFQFLLTSPETGESARYNLWIRKNEIQLVGGGVGGRDRIDFLGKRSRPAARRSGL